MTKLEKLKETVAKFQLEAGANVRGAQQTGNPHLSTRATGENIAYIKVLGEIDKLLVKKEKVK